MWTNPRMGRTPLPTPISNPQTQGIKETSKAVVSLGRATGDRPTLKLCCWGYGHEDRAEEGREEIRPQGSKSLRAPFPLPPYTHTYSHTNDSDAQTRGGAKGPPLDFIPNLTLRRFNPHPVWHCQGGGLRGGLGRGRERV